MSSFAKHSIKGRNSYSPSKCFVQGCKQSGDHLHIVKIVFLFCFVFSLLCFLSFFFCFSNLHLCSVCNLRLHFRWNVSRTHLSCLDASLCSDYLCIHTSASSLSLHFSSASVHPSSHPFRLSIHSVCSSIHPFIPSVHPSIHSVCPSIHPSIHCVHQPNQSAVHTHDHQAADTRTFIRQWHRNMPGIFCCWVYSIPVICALTTTHSKCKPVINSFK